MPRKLKLPNKFPKNGCSFQGALGGMAGSRQFLVLSERFSDHGSSEARRRRAGNLLQRWGVWPRRAPQ